MRGVAARQHGVVSRGQLVALGFEPRAIDRRAEAGQLRPLHRGVYLVGAVPPPLASEMAAVLACGERAVLSHRSAGSLWQLLPYLPNSHPVTVTVPGRDPGTKPGIRIHRVRRLHSAEVTTSKRIPITTPARTLLDLAPILEPAHLEQALARARRRNLVRPPQLSSLLARHPTRHGAPALRRLLEAEDEPAFTRSKAEQLLLTLIRQAELPAPELNIPLHGYEVDFLWRQERLVVEVDGRAYHADAGAFEQDRRRDAELMAHGYRVIRVTWRQLTDAPIPTVARIAAALAVTG